MKTKITLLVLTFTLLLTCDIFSQTIVIDSVSKTGFCYRSEEEFIVYYSVTGAFDNENVFVVQLSYQNGDFSNFNNIGNIKTTLSGEIKCEIPREVNANNYKIRAMSSLPYFVGEVFSNDIIIFSNPMPDFAYDKDIIKLNDSVIFSDSSKNTVEWLWNFGKDAVPPTYSGQVPPPIQYLSTGIKTVILSVVSQDGCHNLTDGEDKIFVFECNTIIDSNAIVVKSDTIIGIKKSNGPVSIWVCSNGHARVEYVSELDKIFIESGGTVDANYIYPSGGVYMKPGASYNMEYVNDGIIFVRSEYASINILKYPNDKRFLKELICDDIEFDYSEAPMEGKIAQHLAVDDNSSLNNLNIFPNPSDGLFNISLNSEVPSFTVTIYDVLGKEIYYENVKNITGTWNKKIDLSGSSKGMYFIKFSNIEKNIIKTIILE